MTPTPVPLTESFDWKGHTVRWGSIGSGPPVLLCHGTPWSSYLWRGLAHALASERTVYVWDMLGYGQSDMVDSDVSLAEQGQIFAALLDHWRLDKPDVVAHDFGGAVSLRAHLLHDRNYRSLALVDVVGLRPWGSPFFTLVNEHADVFGQLPSNLHEALVREYIAGASSGGLTPEVHDTLVSPWITSAGQAAFYRQIAQADEAHTDEIEPLYGSISIPTLVVWGRDDVWIPEDRAHRLVEMIPGAELSLIDGAGHLIQEDAAEMLIARLREWLLRPDTAVPSARALLNDET